MENLRCGQSNRSGASAVEKTVPTEAVHSPGPGCSQAAGCCPPPLGGGRSGGVSTPLLGAGAAFSQRTECTRGTQNRFAGRADVQKGCRPRPLAERGPGSPHSPTRGHGEGGCVTLLPGERITEHNTLMSSSFSRNV